ncbi:hypothetical protein R80B4_00053 [Fibrobacteres bacterium R8-0-B4]
MNEAQVVPTPEPPEEPPKSPEEPPKSPEEPPKPPEEPPKPPEEPPKPPEESSKPLEPEKGYSIISLHELAEICKKKGIDLSYSRLRRLVKMGRIPLFKIGNLDYLSMDMLRKLL